MNRCLIIAFTMAAFLIGCSARSALELKAPMMMDGKKIAIYVLSDRGIEKQTMGRNVIHQRNQLGNWMETDLLRVLKEAGYEAYLIKNQNDYKPETGNYLLSVKIVRYDPGNKANRILIGFGVGAAWLDTHFELYQNSELLLTKDHGVGSGFDWWKCAKKLNVQMTDDISEKLNEIK